MDLVLLCVLLPLSCDSYDRRRCLWEIPGYVAYENYAGRRARENALARIVPGGRAGKGLSQRIGFEDLYIGMHVKEAESILKDAGCSTITMTDVNTMRGFPCTGAFSEFKVHTTKYGGYTYRIYGVLRVQSYEAADAVRARIHEKYPKQIDVDGVEIRADVQMPYVSWGRGFEDKQGAVIFHCEPEMLIRALATPEMITAWDRQEKEEAEKEKQAKLDAEKKRAEELRKKTDFKL